MMEDHKIIELYFARDERAISESSLKYGKYCFSVAQNILCSPEDAEECVNDTWLKGWQSIPPQRPSYLKLYFAKITRNLSFNKRKAQESVRRGSGELPIAIEELSECLPAQDLVEDEVQARALQGALNRFLVSLPQRERSIFLRRYFFTEPFGAIARRYGLREANVRLILSRTRAKLKLFLEKEGYK